MPVPKRSSEYSNRSSASEALSGQSVGELTGKARGGSKIGRNSSMTKAYINDAFSFLEADEYNPYKQYSKTNDDHNILRINLDDQDHSKRTELRLTSSGGVPSTPLRRPRSGKAPAPPKPAKEATSKSPVQAPYVTSIDVQNSPSAPADTGSISTHSTAHSRTLFSSTPSPLSHIQPVGIGAASEKSVSNGKVGLPLHMSSVSYDTIDGVGGKKSDNMGVCSQKRVCILVITFVCIVIIAAAVAIAVYFVGEKNQNTTPSPFEDASSTTVIPETNQFSGMIIYNEDWTADLSDSSSPKYQQVEQTVKDQIQSALTGTDYDEYEVEITDIRPGSVQVWFRLILQIFTTTVNILNSLREGLSKGNEGDGSVMNMTDVVITALPPFTTTTMTLRLPTSSITDTITVITSPSTTSNTTPEPTTTTPPTSTTDRPSTLPSTVPDSTIVVPMSTSTSVPPSTASSTLSTTTIAATTTTVPSTTTEDVTTSIPSTTTSTPSTSATTTTPIATTTTAAATSTMSTEGSASTTTSVGTTTLYIPEDVRKIPKKADECDVIGYSDCEVNGYIRTGTPHKFRPDSVNRDKDDKNNLAAINAVVNLGCYEYAREFLCASYFPECTASKKLIFPCRSFCREFYVNCTFPFVCESFPEDDEGTNCLPSPNQQTELDITEPIPTTCKTKDPLGGFEIPGFLCGNGNCVPESAYCDTVDHCGDMSDELPCSPDSAIDCDFEDEEDSGMCGYTQNSNDHFDWLIGDGSTPTIGTGPQYDHTLRSVSGHYLLAEASGRYRLDRSRILSPSVTFSQDQCLRFYYHMKGETVGSLQVLVQMIPSGEEQLLWAHHRSAGNSWRYGYATLPANEELKVVFETVRGENHLGDMAVDDITAYPGACAELTCMDDEFKCPSSLQCLGNEFVCDGRNDCGDFSDEKDCTCTEEEWQCDFGNCIPRLYKCDHKPDCPDKSDERDCDGCILGQVSCPGENLCIEYQWLCDGDKDCDSGWDEGPQVCTNCSSEQFQCRDYGCVDKTAKCDGIYDCADGSDESYCVRLREVDSILEIYRDNTFLPLCAEDFPGTRLDEICASLGKGAVDRSVPEPVSSMAYLHWSPASSSSISSASNFLQHLSVSSSCYDNQVIAITCMELHCGMPVSLPSPFIVGGDDAEAGEWPWQAALVYKGRRICGGSLVDMDHIVTAAHCVHGKQASDFQISLGTVVTDDVVKTEYRHAVSEFTVHPDYASFHGGDDIAVMTLTDSVQFTDYIQPVCLPRKTDYIPLNSRCYSTGFGRINYKQETYPKQLQEAKMKLVSGRKCRETYEYYRDEMQCAGYDTGITANCKGDSGGPLVCQNPHGHWQLVGAFSFYAGECETAYRPPVFTRIQPYLDFIDDARECVFYCDNGRCLLTNSERCDGHNDCGDYSDEDPQLCGASVSCDFETNYICGYSALSTGEAVLVHTFWPQKGAATVDINNGATVDHTYGTNYGTHMVAGINRAVILSPVLNLTENRCLKVHYHMRGQLVGQLKVFQLSVIEDVIHPLQVSSIEDSVNKLYLENHQGATWQHALIDLDPGRSLVGFEAVARQSNYYPAVSLDDIELMDVECGSMGACSSNQFTCVQDDLCIDQSDRCNFHSLCIDVSDEEGCSSVSRYTCDFETFGGCHLEQDHLDELDWEIEMSNDHTLGNNEGHNMYIDLDGLPPGYRANLNLAVRTPDTESCLSFYYMMDSFGTFRVSFGTSSNDYTEQFIRSRVKVTSWTKVEVTLETGVKEIVINAVSGVIGDWEYTGSSYVKLDDLTIENAKCDVPECGEDQFRCDNGQCIPGFWYCDALSNCEDHSDEKAGCTCDDRWQFRCNSTGRCIKKEDRCDLVQHCADWSDELQCTCTADQFQCSDGRCIHFYQYCDGSVDCPDGGDELECSCFENDFKCELGGCIQSSYRCDGYLDCFDNSDEINCPSCNDNELGYFECDNGICIKDALLCDNYNDCEDYSDERNCICEVDQFHCANGLCISLGDLCNGLDDCGDESDEMQCLTCKVGESLCDDGKCYQTEWACDGYSDCMDGTDEKDCGTCPEGQYQCSSYECLDNSRRCDGNKDCRSGSDELGCVGFHTSGGVFDILHALHDGAWLPVCSDVWASSWSDDICRSMGHGPAIATTSVTVESPQYVTASNSSVKFHSGLLAVASSCLQETVVKVMCEERTCGMRAFDTQPTGFIIGGDLAPDGAWPWMGGLYYRGAITCGLVLIDRYFAISAVHCFLDPNSGMSTASLPNYHTIQLGSNRINDQSAQLLEVSNIILHPDYRVTDSKFRYNDIAVIALKTPAVLSDAVNTMCLPDADSSSSSNDTEPHIDVDDICYVSGWGYSNRDIHQAVLDLRESRYTVWTDTECNEEEYWDNDVEPESQLCAGYSTGNIASCFGDSGSPLVCRDGVGGWKLAGITSMGATDCGQRRKSPVEPTIFTEIQSFVPWIKQTIESNRKR